MNALDLSKGPPRSPRSPLADLDLIMAARTVDKLRATLPGGNLGDYKIEGFSTVLFDRLGITEDEMREAVVRATNDADVAAWLRSRCTQDEFDAVNTVIPSRLVRDRSGDPAFLKRYPLLAELPGDLPLVDMLERDDEAAFR